MKSEYKVSCKSIKIGSRFKPKISEDHLEYYLNPFNERQVENDEIYNLVEKITSLASPSYEDQYDKRWEYFYIPIRRSIKTIVIPIFIIEYNKEFYVTIQSIGNLHIKKGDMETDKFYYDIFKEILRFIPIIKKDIIVLQLIPYDIRTGRIKGMYILEQLLSKEEKKSIQENYQKYLEKNLQIKEISLNDYLNVAAICYKAAYKDANNLSNIEMYKKWADGRDGGMLSIKDWNSKNEFSKWYSGSISGHPFEIVFSWHRHGIHLYPPDNWSQTYNLKVTNYAYAWDFIKMVDALIKNQIPFKSDKLKDVLDFLAGDTYFSVNKLDEYRFMYIQSKVYKKNYFPYIEWDKIKVVTWKQ